MNDNIEPQARPSPFSREFDKYQLKMASEMGIAVLRQFMTVDYSVESLQVLDRRALSQTPEEFRNDIKEMKDQSLASMWFNYMKFGSYFAEVIMKNLGGRWRYPNRILVFFCLWAGYISPAYRHWYLVVGKQKVPVFEIMRRRLEMGAKEESLVKVYNEIANGTYKRRGGS